MATYYVELDGGQLQADAALKGGTMSAAVSFSGAVIYPSQGGGGGSGNMQTKSVSYTPSESAISDAVTPDPGYDGLDRVNVSVDAISPTYVGSGITRRSSSDLTASGATVTAPSGYYESAATKTIPNATLVSAGPLINEGVNDDGSIEVSVMIENGGYFGPGAYNITSAPGEIPTKAAQTYTPGTTDQYVPADKYLIGRQTILGDANLLPENIKKDVEIFGVTGTHEGGGGGETWDIEWDYTDGNPTSNGFALTTGAGGGSATMESDYYSMKSGTSGGTYLVHSPNFTATAGIMEFELYFPSLPAGSNGCIMSGPAFRYFVVGSNIKFFTTAHTSVQVYSGIQANQWYKFKIEYSASEGANMWVNGVLVHTYTSALGYDGTRFMLNIGGSSGTVYVRRLAMVDSNSISAQEAFSIIFGG